MPMLDNQRRENLAQLIARGSSIRQAAVDAGYKGRQNYYRVAKDPEVVARIAEIKAEIDQRSRDVTVHHRRWIDGEMRKLYDRCIQAVPVTRANSHCDHCKGRTGEWRFDAKHAVKLLEMFGLEQGMFKRQLDVTSRKEAMIDGTEDQILEKLAQLLLRLGINSLARLLDRIGEESVQGALWLNGYEMNAKSNGKDHARLGPASTGDDGHGAEARDSDVESLCAVSEATLVS